MMCCLSVLSVVDEQEMTGLPHLSSFCVFQSCCLQVRGFLFVSKGRQCDKDWLVVSAGVVSPECLDWCRWQAARQAQTGACCLQPWCAQVWCGQPQVEFQCGGLGCRLAALLGLTGAVPRPEVEGRPGHSVACARQVM